MSRIGPYMHTPEGKRPLNIYEAIAGSSDFGGRTPSKKGLDIAIGTLRKNERKVIGLRYGVCGKGQCRTLREIGFLMKLSTCRIRQIETKALRKLRHPSRSSIVFDPSVRQLKETVDRLTGEVGNLRDEIRRVRSNMDIRRVGSKIPIEWEGRKVDELELHSRTLNALCRANVVTVEQLTWMTDDELLKLKGFGRSCLYELREVLSTIETGWAYYFVFADPRINRFGGGLHLFPDCHVGNGYPAITVRESIPGKAVICGDCLGRRVKNVGAS